MKKQRITKRQHYVQRAYLSEWTNNCTDSGLLWAYRKPENKTFQSGLMGVGQENYFYEMKRLSDVELMHCVLCARSSIDVVNNNKPYFYLERNQEIWKLEDKIKNKTNKKVIDELNQEISDFKKTDR